MWRIIALLGALTFIASGCGRSQDSLLLLDELPEVSSITIEGNERFSDGEIKKLMALREPSLARPFSSNRFSTRQLDADILAILTFYYRHGYLRARVLDWQVRDRGRKVDITVTVSEGVPVQTAAVILAPVSGLPALDELGVDPDALRDLITIDVGEPYDPFQTADDRRALLHELGNQGFLLGTVTTNAQFLGDRALVFFLVDPGSTYVVSDIEIANNRRVGTKYLKRELHIRAGDLYRRNEVLRSQQALLQTGYFNDVRWDTTAVDLSAATVGLQFRVNERKMRWVEGGFGISSDNRLRLTGTWGTRAFTRIGMRLAFVSRTDLDLDRGVGSYIDEHQSELILRQSNLLGTRWEGQPSSSFIHDRESDYRQNIVGVGVAVRRRLGGLQDQVVLGLENRWVNNNAEPSAVERDAQLARNAYQTRLARGSVQIDSRNDFFDPTRGYRHEVTLEVAGGALGGNNGFRKMTGSVSAFVPAVPERLVLAWRVQAGAIDASNAETTVAGDPVDSEVQLVPVEDRYLLGGANTVRGFAQDELDGARSAKRDEDRERGGILSLLGNIETRYRLSSRFSVVGFLDAGNVWQDDEEFGLDALIPSTDRADVAPADLRYAFGAGFRVSTPVGPIRVDYVRKWNIPAVLAEGKDRWHVSLGHAF